MPVKPRPVSESPPEPMVLSIADLASTLRVSWDAAYRLVRDGVIPSRYIGSRRVVNPSDVRAYVESLPTERGA